MYRTILEV